MILDFIKYFIFFTVLANGRKVSDEQNKIRNIPPWFIFGSSTASYQIEGAWNEDGKSENIWDHASHKKTCVIANCDSGDVAADSYHLYKRDVEMARELGLDYYRFSLSWTRILPTGFPNKINKAAVAYYDNLLNELLAHDIEAMVTIYHWDLPQKLQSLGGWTNPYIVEWFADYARTVFKLFGSKVKFWITINEAREICYQGYAAKTLAPFLNITGIAEYMCAKNILMAHATAWHIYDKEFRELYGGNIGMAISANWFEPATENDIEAAENANQFEWGQYAHPIFSRSGDFPPVMKQKIALKSTAQGFQRSRLPTFCPSEIEFVYGTFDFFGVNHYTTFLAYRNEQTNWSPSYYDDMSVGLLQPKNWEGSASEFVKVAPWGLYKLLLKIKKDFDNPPVFITENGFATLKGLNDNDRISYMRKYLEAMFDALEQGCDIRAYTAWSLMDNFEWTAGYSQRFGLYEVDFNDTRLTRTPRKSAFVYKEILRSHRLDPFYEPHSYVMKIDEGN